MGNGLVRMLRGSGLALALMAGNAAGFEFDLLDGDLAVRLNSKLSVGATWRMQDRDQDLIGKLNLNPGLCDQKNCLFEENADLVAAPGAFSGVNGDDGNLNYDQYDMVAATSELNADLSVSWRDYLFRVRGIGYFDPVNVGFDETHTDTNFQPASTRRPGSIEDTYARRVDLYEAYVQRSFEWFERSAVVTVGNQIVRWGESTLVALNSLSEINPPNAALFRMPGAELNELFQPVPLALFSTDVVPGVSAEVLYQFGWKAVQPDPRGSFMSDSDLIGGRNAYITLGQFGENPDRQPVLVPFEPSDQSGNSLEAISSTTVTTYLLSPDQPRDLGQYGARVNYFAEWLNHGTDLSFYALNYHSRLPYASIYATNESCARDSVTATVAADCNGFNGSANPGASHDPNSTSEEPLPIQTLNARLTYPEDIRMFGASFNTNIGSWSLAGEYSYRPNVPMQIHLTDLIFMGLNPAFPVNDVPLGAGPGSLGTIPAAQNAIPSYLLRYRGRSYSDNATRVQPNEQIPGYERMKVEQVDFTAIKAISNNPFRAEQILMILEAGMTHVRDMPGLDELQFEGGGPNRTHYSNGADGTGDPVPLTDAERQKRLNPTRQIGGFATPFSWGLRSITRLEYNDVLFGWTLFPTVVAAWDVKGISPYPLQNFVEGRKEFTAGTEIQFSQYLSSRILYQWFTGGGRENTRKDRDNASLSVTYAF